MQKIIKFSLLVLLVSNVNATMMPRKNNNSNSNQGLARVNRGLGRKQKQDSKIELSEKKIKNVIFCDDLVTFEKVAWKNISMPKDEMLRRACIYGSPKIVLHLIKEGANVDSKDNNDSTLLHIAVMNQKPKIVELLIKDGANVNSKDKHGNTPLYYTLGAGNISLARLLIEMGTNIDSKDNFNRDVIEYGLKISSLKSSKYLSAKEKENTLKVVDYIKSVVEEKKRLNRAGIIGAGEDLDIYPV